MHLEVDDFVAGCKLRKHCPSYSLEAMVLSALSELIKATSHEPRRQVGHPMAAGTAKDGPQYRKICIKAWGWHSFSPLQLGIIV